MTNEEVNKQWHSAVRSYRIKKILSDPKTMARLHEKGRLMAKEMEERRRERIRGDNRMWKRMRHRVIGPIH